VRSNRRRRNVHRFLRIKELPFALTPDRGYLYFTPSHTEVWRICITELRAGRGLIVVTGRSRHRKTTLTALDDASLDPTVMVAYVFNPRLSVAEFYQYLAALFNIGAWKVNPIC
jgi:type II secretory pathway predicted ATPase ExeA